VTVIDWPTKPFDHVYELIPAVAVSKTLLPAQTVAEAGVAVTDTAGGLFTITVVAAEVVEQLNPLVIVTVYGPAADAEMLDVVAPPGDHK